MSQISQDTLGPYLCALGFSILAALLLRYWLEPYVVSSQSMQPLLHPGERVLVFKNHLCSRRPKAGDIVVFEDPRVQWSLCRPDAIASGSAAPPLLTRRRWLRGRELIKQVVAVGRDTVVVCRGVVLVNGVPRTWVGSVPQDSAFGPTELPVNSFFVLGADLRVSRDSREFGPVPWSLVLGRAWAVYWPPRKARLLRGTKNPSPKGQKEGEPPTTS